MTVNEKRLIDANAFKVFLEDVRQCYLEEDTFSSDFAAEVIETVQDNYLDLAPTVDSVEVVHSQWDTVFYQRSGELSSYTHLCPKCKYLYRDLRFKGHDYCPNCGAKMDGGADNG